MKRFLKLSVLLLIVASLSPLPVQVEADAQGAVLVSGLSQTVATAIVNGTVVSSASVELDGEPYLLNEVEISDRIKGSLAGSVLVEVPGGFAADGSRVVASHQPYLSDGDRVQLALIETPATEANLLGQAMLSTLPIHSIVGGMDGTAWLNVSGVSQAEAAGDFALNGSRWDDFTPPVPYRIRAEGSSTRLAVQRGFLMWESDQGSSVNFSYAGPTNRFGLNLGDGENVVSWVTTPNPADTWLAQAYWRAGSVGGGTAAFDILVNRDYNFSASAQPNRFDISTTIGHEVGHVLGLAHVSPSSEIMNGIIPAGIRKPLGAGDISGVRSLYAAAIPFTGTTTCPTSIVLGSLRSGIAVRDTAPGTGYVMWSSESVHSRFFPRPYRSNASHLIAVKFSGGAWYYDNNSLLTNFVPRTTDCLVAAVNFDTDVVTSFRGIDSRVGGIDAGYAEGDLVITGDRYAGRFNDGELGVSGTFVSQQTVPPFTGSTNCPATMTVGNLRLGVAARDSAPGSGYIMWSGESVHTRFSPRPNTGNANHFIAVKYSTGRWYYDNNSVLTAFTPRATDCLVAAVSFANDTATTLSRSSRIGGIDVGFSSGTFSITADRFGNQSNDGEFALFGQGNLTH